MRRSAVHPNFLAQLFILRKYFHETAGYSPTDGEDVLAVTVSWVDVVIDKLGRVILDIGSGEDGSQVGLPMSITLASRGKELGKISVQLPGLCSEHGWLDDDLLL